MITPNEPTTPRTPTETFLALVHGVAHGPRDALADLYAEQTDVRHPFAPDRPPLRTRDDLRAHFTLGPDAPQIEREPVDIVVHETADREVIVAEFAYACTIAATGVAYRLPCVFVLRVRDGLIVESRDYIDPLATARALEAG